MLFFLWVDSDRVNMLHPGRTPQTHGNATCDRPWSCPLLRHPRVVRRQMGPSAISHVNRCACMQGGMWARDGPPEHHEPFVIA